IASNDIQVEGDFSESSGPSIRTLIEVADTGPRMKVSLPGGSDLHRKSKFYNNMVPSWLSNTPVDFAFGVGAVKNPAVDITVFAGVAGMGSGVLCVGGDAPPRPVVFAVSAVFASAPADAALPAPRPFHPRPTPAPSATTPSATAPAASHAVLRGRGAETVIDA